MAINKKIKVSKIDERKLTQVTRNTFMLEMLFVNARLSRKELNDKIFKNVIA